MMIDPELDHDEKTEPGGGWPILSQQELDELAERVRVALPFGASVTVPVEVVTLAELVRLYRGAFAAGSALDRIGQLAAALDAQVEAANVAAEAALRRAGARYEILLRWGSTQSGFPVDCVGWHEDDRRFRWRGTFEEAVQIINAKYGPKRGTEALIVVRVEQ